MKQDINLYQPELRPRIVPLRAAVVGRLLGLLLLGLALVYWYAAIELRPVRERAAAATARAAGAESRLAEARANHPPPRPDAALTRRLERARRELAQTREVALKLRRGDYGSVDGLSVYLEGLARQHVEGAWLTGVRIERGGRAVGLEGRALQPELVPTYLERLAGEAAFKGKAFSALELEAAPDGLGEILFSVRTPGLAPKNKG